MPPASTTSWLAEESVPASLRSCRALMKSLCLRARHGYRVRESTLRRIVTAMLRIPTMPGVELLLSEPEKRAG